MDTTNIEKDPKIDVALTGATIYSGHQLKIRDTFLLRKAKP